MDAFDADAIIYAATPNHPIGRRVAALFPPGARRPGAPAAGVGSLLLLPEVLSKPTREGRAQEIAMLGYLLAQLDLRPLDASTAFLALALAASYQLSAADAVHLATAVRAGADRFITNNQRDFPRTIAEIDVTYPADLA
jgi:predicted nucleic acid-binding protein